MPLAFDATASDRLPYRAVTVVSFAALSTGLTALAIHATLELDGDRGGLRALHRPRVAAADRERRDEDREDGEAGAGEQRVAEALGQRDRVRAARARGR